MRFVLLRNSPSSGDEEIKQSSLRQISWLAAIAWGRKEKKERKGKKRKKRRRGKGKENAE
jgi:hypothetical protein